MDRFEQREMQAPNYNNIMWFYPIHHQRVLACRLHTWGRNNTINPTPHIHNKVDPNAVPIVLKPRVVEAVVTESVAVVADGDGRGRGGGRGIWVGCAMVFFSNRFPCLEFLYVGG